MDEWDEHRSIQQFKETINNLNIRNIRNSSNVIKGMIMGHSPQFMYNKGINSSYDNRIWRVDIGASKAFGEIDTGLRKVHVLVIEDDSKFHIVMGVTTKNLRPTCSKLDPFAVTTSCASRGW